MQSAQENPSGDEDVHQFNTDGKEFSAQELVERLKTTKTSPNSGHTVLSEITAAFRYLRDEFSDDQKSECFDVFYHHIRKPVLSEGTAFDVFLSVLGIKLLGHENAYSVALKDEFIEAWPWILRSLKATLSNPTVLKLPLEHFQIATELFLYVHTVHGEALKGNDAFEVAVSIWKGRLGEGGEDHYHEAPLYISLQKEIDNDNRPSHIMNFYKNDPEVLAEHFLTRLETQIFRTSPIYIGKVIRLASLMEMLERRRAGSAIKTFLSQKTGPALVPIINTLLSIKNVSDDRFMGVAVLFCQLISRCILLGPFHGESIVQAGVLEVALNVKVALRGKEADTEGGPSDILTALLYRLVHKDLVEACQKSFYELYRGDTLVKDLLKNKTSGNFKFLWKSLQTAVLEQAVLSRLFDLGYAPELQTCASHACRKLAPRPQFKLCSGCSIAVYCSDSCQTTDWSTHRRWCKQITKEPDETTPYALERFTRRAALIHISRHLPPIELKATSEPLRLNQSFVGVLINYETYPYRFSPFDYRTFLCDDIKFKSSLSAQAIRHAMVANEVSRLKEAQFDCMMVVISIAKSNTPFIFHLSGRGYTEGQSGWAKALSSVPKEVADKGREMDEKMTYDIEGSWRPLGCHFVDALRAAVGYAHTYAADSKKSIWRNDILDKAAGSVMGEFEELILDSGVGGNGVKAIAVDRGKAYGHHFKDGFKYLASRPRTEFPFLL